MCSNQPQVQNSSVRAKWTRCATQEDTARISIQYGNFLACKRRQLLKQIKLSNSRRNGFNSLEEENTEIEHWAWSPNNGYDDTLQLQAVNCSNCGNYKKVRNANFELCNHIRCNCENDYDEGEEEYKYAGDGEDDSTTVIYN